MGEAKTTEIPGTDIRLPFGDGTIVFATRPELSGRLRLVRGTVPVPLADPKAEIVHALSRTIYSAPLAEIAAGKKSACIVVSDETRPVPNRLILPPLLDTLTGAGVPMDAITILIATGLHGPTPDTKFQEIYGPEAATFRIANHDARDATRLRTVGRLLSGTRLEISSVYLDAELKILTGMVEPHGLAGFSGGGKSLVPGIAGIDLIKAVHSYKIVEEIGDGIGKTAGNPFREVIDLAMEAAGADFMVNVIPSGEAGVAGVFAGHPKSAVAAALCAAEDSQIADLDEKADAVITTGGGAPLDRTFYQACKGIISAARMVKPGGTILLAARCENGAGSAHFEEILTKAGSPEGFRKIYSDAANFTIDQWAVQALLNATGKAGKVLVYSPGLDGRHLAPLGFGKCYDFEKGAATLAERSSLIYVAPEGPLVTARVGGGSRRKGFMAAETDTSPGAGQRSV